MPRAATYPTRALSRLLGIDAAGQVGLAPAPPPSNRRVAFLGDSMTWQGTINDAGNAGHVTGGIQSWLRFLTGQRFDYNPGYGVTVSSPVVQSAVVGGMNFGVPSETTTMILARTDAALAWSDAAIWVVFAGTNDPSSNVASSTTAANLAAIRDKILAAGRTVIFVAPTPRGSQTYNSGAAPLTGQRLAWHLRNRQWMIDQRSVAGVYVADPWRDVADTSSLANNNAGYIEEGLTRDGLHQMTPGAYRIALSIADQLRAILPPVDILPMSGAAAWSVDNPGGLLTPNPRLLGTGGTITTQAAVTASGALADGWNTQFSPNTAGLTLAYSKVVGSGGPMQQIAVSGTPTGASPAADLIRYGSAIPNLAVGDAVEGVAQVEIDGPANVRAVSLFIYDATGVRFYGDMMNTMTDMGDVLPNVNLRGVMRTPRLTVPTGANLRFGVMMRGVQNQALAATIRLGALALRKVA